MSAPESLDAALEALLRRHSMRLRAAIDRHCRGSTALDPDDLAQEVRIRLWRALGRDRNAEFSASYLQRTVLSVVVDAVRRSPPPADSMQAAQEEGVEIVPEALVQRDGPEADARGKAAARALHEALSELPAQRRMAVQFTLQGFAAKECGELLGVSDEAARKLAERGLVLVREHLRHKGFGEFDDR